MSHMLCDSIKSSGAWLMYKGYSCNLGVYFHAHYSISTKHISALHLGILGQWKLSCSINPFGFGPCTCIIKDKKGSDLLQKILTLAHGWIDIIWVWAFRVPLWLLATVKGNRILESWIPRNLSFMSSGKALHPPRLSKPDDWKDDLWKEKDFRLSLHSCFTLYSLWGADWWNIGLKGKS